MRRILLVTLISAVMILLSAPGAVVAGSSMVEDSCDMSPMHPKSTTPSCCESDDCLSVCCSLPDTPSDKAIVTNLPAPIKNIVFSFFKTAESIEITDSFDKPTQEKTDQILSFHLFDEYHCRNSLDSEESFHI